MSRLDICSIKYSMTKTSKLNKFLSTLHKNIDESCKYIKNLDINIDENDQTRDILISNKYFPYKIQDYIKNNTTQKNVYTTRINNKNIILKFVNCNMEEYNSDILFKYANLVFMIIYLLSLYSSKSCSQNLHINIYLTPCNKFFPSKKSDIIGVDHVNSGFSNIGCQETTNITIYREEEWIKVLIHELFHNLDLDFSSMDITKWSNMLSNKFEINCDFAIYETYCETWARILNVAIKSFTLDKKEFIADFKFLIHRERIHSLLQASKILKRFKTSSEYIEDSNVFCYYILTASLMNNYLDFILWCQENNSNLLYFKKTEKSLKSFVDLILTETDSDSFKKSLDCIKQYINDSNSLRMTIV